MCPTAWLSKCLTVLLYRCPTVWLSKCLTVELSNCGTVWLLNCLTVLLTDCLSVRPANQWICVRMHDSNTKEMKNHLFYKSLITQNTNPQGCCSTDQLNPRSGFSWQFYLVGAGSPGSILSFSDHVYKVPTGPCQSRLTLWNQVYQLPSWPCKEGWRVFASENKYYNKSNTTQK